MEKSRENVKKSNENVEDITKLPKYRLIELLDRQNKLLSCRKALESLPDKGDKVKDVKKQIENELEKRAANSDLSEFMKGLNLSAPQINALEWTNNIHDVKNDTFNESEGNTLKIIATHSGTEFSKKTVKVKQQQLPPLITEEDIEEIYAMKLWNKIDQVEPNSKFLPHKTLKHSYSSKKKISEYKPQDLCSAFEPPSKFNNVKSITLEASIKLQYEQAQHLKEVQLKHATERLKDKTHNIGDILPSKEKLQAYRNPLLLLSDSEGEDNEEEIQEVEDECGGEDKEGIVTYHVTD